MTATTPKAAPAKSVRKAAVKPPAKASAKSPAKAAVAKAPAVPKAAGKAAQAKTGKVAKADGAALQVPPITAEVVAAKPQKAPEPKKTKLVRDSFTIPRAEYQLLQDLKQRAAGLGRPAKKSEVLRAGIMALAALDEKTFLAALAAVPVIKTGRPAKG